ncbi:MAG: putative DNA binding domain-containing protein [Deltaproteobacteria bacterium]|nr:putative DNA binding domain-containing protein [Deltaproteobacteria bacterium]
MRLDLNQDNLLDHLPGEDVDLEAKLASGKDGKGELPESFWETYSAMANTEGGYVLLGVEEKPPKHFQLIGIEDTDRVLKKLWDCLNDRDKVSANLLTNQDVVVKQENKKNYLIVHIPRASRSQRPVHLKKNPFGNTFRRHFEGDYRCDDETVKRMLADNVEEIRDAKTLKTYDLGDLDMEAFKVYRQHFKSQQPNHPWNDAEDTEFLRLIGGWSKDRETGKRGLTVAGLLMFGQLRSILDEFPYYVVDYQERPEPKTEPRWIDRLTTDGTWSGNLYDFYRKVIQKLYADLKVPFSLEGAVRKDDTPIHEALREALTNTIIHADYTGRVSVLVVKRPDLYGFRNPGTMRISLELALQGGHSDCRNRNIQKMFQLIGYGDQAGSGIPKILKDWQTNQYRRPPLWEERLDPDQTLLTLPLASLIPEATLKHFAERYGSKFKTLNDVQRLALATVDIEGRVSHSRLASMTTAHRTDVTEHLRSLVKGGFLIAVGVGRGTYYVYPGEEKKAELDFLDSFFSSFQNDRQAQDSTIRDEKTEQGMPPIDEKQPGDSEHYRRRSEHLNRDSEQYLALLEIARPVSEKGKADKALVSDVLMQLCSGRFMELRTLAELLHRRPDSIRNHYITPLLKEGLLEPRYPERPNHPNQAYRKK